MIFDIQLFLQHINKMLEIGMQATLAKHSYYYSYNYDRQYLTSWLELLVFLRQLHFSIDVICRIMDHMTWFNIQTQIYSRAKLNRFEGTLVVNGKMHMFTPFLL